MSERVTVICPDCKQHREISREATLVKDFTGRCSSCAGKARMAKRFPGPQGGKVEVTCGDCGNTRKINKASTQCGGYTGLCMTCARKRTYALKHPQPVVETDRQPSKPPLCLKCDAIIPYDPYLKLCEICRATNMRQSDEEVYGETVKVKVGYSVW